MKQSSLLRMYQNKESEQIEVESFYPDECNRTTSDGERRCEPKNCGRWLQCLKQAWYGQLKERPLTIHIQSFLTTANSVINHDTIVWAVIGVLLVTIWRFWNTWTVYQLHEIKELTLRCIEHTRNKTIAFGSVKIRRRVLHLLQQTELQRRKNLSNTDRVREKPSTNFRWGFGTKRTSFFLKKDQKRFYGPVYVEYKQGVLNK